MIVDKVAECTLRENVARHFCVSVGQRRYAGLRGGGGPRRRGTRQLHCAAVGARAAARRLCPRLTSDGLVRASRRADAAAAAADAVADAG